MKSRTLAVAACAMVVATAAPLLAQESKPADDPAAPEEERAEPVTHIKVLQHPYDIAKFYRSSQGEGFGMSESSPGATAFDPYSIASYYRSSAAPGAYGYSRFWSMGYTSQGRVSPLYGRRMGRNGDLFLFAPTFLAPVGPLNGVFFGDVGGFR